MIIKQVSVGFSCQSKICNLGNKLFRSTLLIQEDILRLKIPVNIVILMYLFDAIANVFYYFGCYLFVYY